MRLSERLERDAKASDSETLAEYAHAARELEQAVDRAESLVVFGTGSKSLFKGVLHLIRQREKVAV